MNMGSIYRRIAKENGVSVEEVKRDMQTAIEYAYKNNCTGENDRKRLKYELGKRVPSNEEFITYVASRLQE